MRKEIRIFIKFDGVRLSWCFSLRNLISEIFLFVHNQHVLRFSLKPSLNSLMSSGQFLPLLVKYAWSPVSFKLLLTIALNLYLPTILKSFFVIQDNLQIFIVPFSWDSFDFCFVIWVLLFSLFACLDGWKTLFKESLGIQFFWLFFG